MKSKSRKPLRFPFYPFLLACYPVLYLFQVNFQEVDPRVIIRPLFVSIVFTSLILLITYLLSMNIHRSAAFTSLFLILFFSYGRIYNVFSNPATGGFFLGRHRWLIIFYLLVFALITWMIFKKMNGGDLITGFLNLIVLVLVALPLIQIVFEGIKQSRVVDVQPNQENKPFVSSESGEKPDIYYIILDMYTREDALANNFHFDNSKFLKELEKRGFYIARCSRSNYVQTELSLGSSLNMEYLQNLSPKLDPKAENMDSMVGFIKDNRVRKLLEDAGYKTVAFDTGYFWDSWIDAKYYFSPSTSSSLTSKFTPFEGLFLNTTALLPILESRLLSSQKITAEINNPVQSHIDRELYKLDKLGKIAGISGPKFVFAHIMIPHFPFVFRGDGSIQTDLGYFSNHNTPIDEEHYIDGYIQEVEFINSRILSVIDQILESSKTQPVIILQGDHGARDENRLSILNAYYLPSGDSGLYPTITPVNTFRLVFNEYLNSDLGNLPDKSYFSPGNLPYQFVEKPESSPACLP